MEKLLTEKELADLLVISILTIRRNRSTAPHRPPPAVKFGSSVRYQMSTVVRWLNDHEVGHDTPKTSNLLPGSEVTKVIRRGRPSKAETVRTAKNAGK